MCGLLQAVPIADCIFRMMIRGKVRIQKGIDGSVLGDFFTGCCCYPCTVAQEAQEVKAINMARQ